MCMSAKTAYAQRDFFCASINHFWMIKPFNITVMNSKKSLIPFLLLLIPLIILGLTFVAYAQPSLPSAPSQAPIDGGLGLLAAAGGAYAYKKLKGRNREQ